MNKITLTLTGGIYNNRKIVSYNPNTKTTASIVRTAVFNILNLKEGIILDLFSGSGAYGFESLSRGADKVYFNDYNKLSIKAIKENAKTLNCNDKITVTELDYLKALNFYKNNNIKFNYCFIDPPYDMDDTNIENILITILSFNDENLEIILERKKDSSSFEIEGLTLVKKKNYGTRQIQYYISKR